MNKKLSELFARFNETVYDYNIEDCGEYIYFHIHGKNKTKTYVVHISEIYTTNFGSVAIDSNEGFKSI
jgi:ribosomal protein L20A (L18A)